MGPTPFGVPVSNKSPSYNKTSARPKSPHLSKEYRYGEHREGTHLETHDARDETDQTRDVEDHVDRRSGLLHFPIDAELQADFGRVGDP
jgi:hypothetical protein